VDELVPVVPIERRQRAALHLHDVAGVVGLPRDWRYVAWIDADVHFLNRDWAQETLHQTASKKAPKGKAARRAAAAP